ncbi:uncharacterized protein RAG0_06294 [Rhynchosporium agropyri]|uniref:Uncharacterized protein n=1 Tax=Rhynchosporium agropyri TaxID=914238 RepID=A0A1E1KK12_9HELO|nr:uncharacterized protein RAG0_06294 [Rhynchosporium agropyri]
MAWKTKNLEVGSSSWILGQGTIATRSTLLHPERSTRQPLRGCSCRNQKLYTAIANNSLVRQSRQAFRCTISLHMKELNPRRIPDAPPPYQLNPSNPLTFVNRENRVPHYQRMFQQGAKQHVRQWNQTPKSKLMLYPYYVALFGGLAGSMYMMVRLTLGHKTWFGKN